MEDLVQERAEEEVSLFTSKKARDTYRKNNPKKTKKIPKKSIPRVVLFIEGGVLHWGCSDRKVQVMLVDKDVEGCDDYREITHPDGQSEECYVSLVRMDTSSKVTAHYWKQLETTGNNWKRPKAR